MSTPLFIYHAPCADGFTAAWVARKLFPLGEFVPAVHGKALPDVSGRNVTFLDYLPKPHVLAAMLPAAATITVIDHHEGAFKEAGDLVNQVSLFYYDTKKSGAGLAWDVYFQGRPRPWLVDYVEDRDLWNWKLPRSREVSAALDTYAQTFEQWELLAQRNPEAIADDGIAFRVYEEAYFRRTLPEAREVTFAGYKVLAINSTLLQSELGAALAKGRAFAIVWRQKADGGYSYSLRSAEDGLDVSVIAQNYGGNGHPHAAGFSNPTLLF